jgi:hypothetical protein
MTTRFHAQMRRTIQDNSYSSSTKFKDNIDVVFIFEVGEKLNNVFVTKRLMNGHFLLHLVQGKPIRYAHGQEGEVSTFSR